ncbi:MAG: two-component regulator propeller domain-containing protein [Bacteroidota bacterium]
MRFFKQGICLLPVLAVLSGCDKGEPEPGISFDMVTGFVICSQGYKYLATDNGLFILDVGKGEYIQVEDPESKKVLNDLAFAPAQPQEELWLATDAGAYNSTAQYLLTEENSGLSRNPVTHLNFDHKLTGYFATREGLDILVLSEWTHTTGLNDLFLDFEITDLGTATNGYTYVTTLGGGIERFKMDADGISGATRIDTDWSWLASDNILTVCIDDTVQAYGTDRGAALHFSEYTKWDWEVYSTADGLINDTVQAIVRDNAKNWWFGTNGGVSRFDEATWTAFTVETHGLISNHIRFMAVDTDGSIWLATDLGLSHLTGDQILNFPK